MLVDPGALAEGPRTLLIAAVLVVSVVVTKLVAAWLTGALYGYSRDQVFGMFGLSLGQAAAALAIVLIGFEVGIDGFDQEMINAVVLMILVASLISPAVVDRAGAGIVRATGRDDYDPEATPQRILIPVSSESKYGEVLVDLAIAIREPGTAEPLRALSVVEPGEDVETELERAETMLERTAEHAAGAEVPMATQTRVDYNVASGIVNASVENRITTLVIGWDGARSRRQRTFGDTIDQVLGRTDHLVLVSRIRDPLNTLDEVVLLLPPGIDHNAGFAEAIHTVATVTRHAGARIRAVVVEDDPERYERPLDRVGPEVTAAVEGVEDWKALLALLRDDVSSGDLVVCMSARRGSMGRHPQLRTLPKSVSTLIPDGSFVVVYPARAKRADDRQFLRLR
jgi:hypothetical protein